LPFKKTKGVKDMSVSDIVQACVELNNRQILITGGEPLDRDRQLIKGLLLSLLRLHYRVQVETGGYIPLIGDLESPHLYWIVDRKGPSSKMTRRNLPPEKLIHDLRGKEGALKYVVADEKDLNWAIKDMQLFEDALPPKIPFLLSPIDGTAAHLSWMTEKLPKNLLGRVVFSVQIHKLAEMP